MDAKTNIEIRPGIYEHFKGGLYEVRSVAMLVDSDRQFVVYCRYDEQDKVFLRELSEFLQYIDRDGRKVPRFRFLRMSVEHQIGNALSSFD